MPRAAPVTRHTFPCNDGPILSEKRNLLDVLFVAILQVLRIIKFYIWKLWGCTNLKGNSPLRHVSQSTKWDGEYAYLHLIHRDAGLPPEGHVGIQSLPDVLNIKGTLKVFYRKMQFHIPVDRWTSWDIKLRNIAFMKKLISARLDQNSRNFEQNLEFYK